MKISVAVFNSFATLFSFMLSLVSNNSNMKRIYLLISLITISFLGSAQSYEGNIQYDKKKQQAIVIDYDYPAQAVENAIILKMQRLGYKAKEEKGIFNKDKGFIVFKNAYVTDISNDRMDYIINVERKSRKKEDESVLYLVMLKGDQNAMVTMDAENVGKAKIFLNNMLPEIEEAHLEIQIKEQESVVAKAEKKYKELVDEQISLEKKLDQNRQDQDNTQKDIEAQKNALGILIGKRKS